jgi:capsular exopolysaccharide synthesis family protein
MENFKDTIPDEPFDIKGFIYKILGYWHLFVISIVLAIGIAYCINRTTTPVYEVRTALLLQEEQPPIDAKFSYGLNVYNSANRVFNEIGILKSYTLTERALKKLDFTIGYYSNENFTKKELYNDCPFIFLIDSGSPQPLFIDIKVKILSPTTFSLEAKDKQARIYNFSTNQYITELSDYQLEAKGTIHKLIVKDYFAGRIIPRNSNDLSNSIGKTYYFTIFNEPYLINKYRLFRVTDNKNSSIITISIEGNNINKQVDFLNTLTKEYLIKGLEKKNNIADNTIRFIDSQLGEVTDSLYFSEKRLQDYRANNTIMNVDFQTQQVFTNLETLQNQRAALIVKSKYYEYLKNYINENKDGQNLVAPSSLGIDDPGLSNLLNDLTGLFNERAELSVNLKRDNPMLVSADTKIKNAKKVVLGSIENLNNAVKISLQDIDQRIDNISHKVNKMPETERKLFGYERKFKLNDALYTFLLTKRSEVQIAKASYLPENEVLDVARNAEYIPIAPKSKRNFIIALILGFGLPIAYLLLKDFFNDKILINEDIEAITDYPILGYIIHNKDKTHTVVADSPLSLTAESIRAIRTNFQFIGSEKGKNVVLVTSSMMGEGKSFISLNLAICFAQNDKKTVLINFDMRKPKTHNYLNMDNDKGLSLYLSGNASIEDILKKTSFENLDVILAGTIPPNPMELISGKNTAILLDELKKRYDTIIIDSPPVGMVADSLLLIHYTDVLLYITRQSHTLKRVFSQQIDNFQKKGIKNVNIILNDIQIGRKYQNYSYGYAYTYGYGYVYGENDKKKKIRKKIEKTES